MKAENKNLGIYSHDLTNTVNITSTKSSRVEIQIVVQT